MKNIIFILLSIINVTPLNAAESYKFGDRLFVASPKGLNLRVEPSSTSKILAELKYSSQITIIDKLPFIKSFSYLVTNFNGGNIQLKGHWVKVSFNNLVGYVFDGNLTNYKYEGQGVGLNYHQIFGVPKIDSVKSFSEPVDGKRYEKITSIKTFPKILKEVEVFSDDCWDVKQTFKNITFNEAYWLINRDMIDADAATDVKLYREKDAIVLTYYSCT